MLGKLYIEEKKINISGVLFPENGRGGRPF